MRGSARALGISVGLTALALVLVDGRAAHADPPDSDGDGVVDELDCAPTDPNAFQELTWQYTDFDEDGYRVDVGEGVWCFGAAGLWPGFYPPSAGPGLGPDCQDLDPGLWQRLAYTHTDLDGDGVFTHVGEYAGPPVDPNALHSGDSVCVGASLPTGYTDSVPPLVGDNCRVCPPGSVECPGGCIEGTAGADCTTFANPNQLDAPDGDGIGDICDADWDGDVQPNETDPCPLESSNGCPEALAAIPNGICDKYVTAHADGLGSGSEESPWTLAQANALAAPGDEVCLHPYYGHFVGQGSIDPQSSGTASDFIVYKGLFENADPVIKSTVESGIGACIRIADGIHHVEVSHLTCNGFEGSQGDGCSPGATQHTRMKDGIRLLGGDDNYFHDLTIEYVAQRGITLYEGSTFNKFVDNEVRHTACNRLATTAPRPPLRNLGEALELRGADSNYFAGNRLEEAQHNLLSITGSSHNVLVENTLVNESWTIAIVGTTLTYDESRHNLIADNVIQGAYAQASTGLNPGIAHAGLYLRNGYSIVRNNIIWGGAGAGVQISPSNDSAWGFYGPPQVMDVSSNRVYHNLVAANGYGPVNVRDMGSITRLPAVVSDNKFVNNFFANNQAGNPQWPRSGPPPHVQRDWDSMVVFNMRNATAAPFLEGNHVLTNVIGGVPDQNLFYVRDEAAGGPSALRTLADFQDPQVIVPPSPVPVPVYPMVQGNAHYFGATANAGQALTKMTSCDQSNVILVEDPYFLSKGIPAGQGLASHPGDLITIEGLAEPLPVWRVLDVDYDAKSVTLNGAPCMTCANPATPCTAHHFGYISLAFEAGQTAPHIGLDTALDSDADGQRDLLDNCSALVNDQADGDVDGYGDACDMDAGAPSNGPSGLWCAGQGGCVAP